MIKTSYLRNGLESPPDVLEFEYFSEEFKRIEDAPVEDWARAIHTLKAFADDIDTSYGWLPSLAGEPRRYRVVALRQTCGAFPSQWEGETDEGEDIYIRFRSGWLQARVSTPDAPDAVCAPNVATIPHGHPHAGEMDTEQMQALLAYVFDFEEVQ